MKKIRIIALIFVLIIPKIIPFFIHWVPLGYDPGLYRAIYNVYNNMLPYIDFSALPLRLKHEPLRAFRTMLLSFMGLHIDFLLTRGYVAISLIISFLLYMHFNTTEESRPNNTKYQFFFIILLWGLSIVQFEAFSYMYYKQLIGIVLMLLIFFFREKKTYYHTIPLIACLFLLHRTTSVYFIATSVLFFITQWVQYKKINKAFAICIIVAGTIWLVWYIPYFTTLIGNFIQPALSSLSGDWLVWLFFTRYEFLRYEVLLTPFVIAWLIYKIKHQRYDIWFRGCIVWLLRMGSWFINYRRSFIDFDIFLIVLAGQGMAMLREKILKIISIPIVILIILQLGYFFSYVQEHSVPLISKEQLHFLQQLDLTLPKTATIMIDSSSYTTRVMWYTNRQRISPWLSDLNIRDKKWWDSRRAATPEWKCLLMQTFPPTSNYNDIFFISRTNTITDNIIKQTSCFTFIQTDAWLSLFHYNKK